MTHLIDVRINGRAMYTWAKAIGLIGADQGYIVHSLICAAYGSHRMQPFRMYNDQNSGQVRLLGYCAASAEELIAERQAVAEPLVSTAFLSEVSKEMPSAWKVGSNFTFNLLVSPVVTISGTRKQVDAFMQAQEGSTREDVYADWLKKRLDGKAEIKELSLKAFSLEKVARRQVADENGNRPLGKTFTIPRAEFDGVLAVTDGDAFSALFQNSIGKHGAFGYGAILLRPTKA